MEDDVEVFVFFFLILNLLFDPLADLLVSSELTELADPTFFLLILNFLKVY